MPTIRTSADLRNRYNEISEFCHAYAEPVFITKKGKVRPFSDVINEVQKGINQ